MTSACPRSHRTLIGGTRDLDGDPVTVRENEVELMYALRSTHVLRVDRAAEHRYQHARGELLVWLQLVFHARDSMRLCLTTSAVSAVELDPLRWRRPEQGEASGRRRASPICDGVSPWQV